MLHCWGFWKQTPSCSWGARNNCCVHCGRKSSLCWGQLRVCGFFCCHTTESWTDASTLGESTCTKEQKHWGAEATWQQWRRAAERLFLSISLGAQHRKVSSHANAHYCTWQGMLIKLFLKFQLVIHKDCINKKMSTEYLSADIAFPHFNRIYVLK